MRIIFFIACSFVTFFSCKRPYDPSPDCVDFDSLYVVNKSNDTLIVDSFFISQKDKMEEFCSILRSRSLVYGPNLRSTRGAYEVLPMKDGYTPGGMRIIFTIYDGTIISGSVGKYYRSERMGIFITENAPKKGPK